MREYQKELLTEQMKIHQACSVRVGGYCMSPVIRDNAEVTLEPVADPAALRPGEIVAYFIGTQLLVHRLLGNNGTLLRLNGDNIDALPHEIAPEAVFGRVRKIKNPGFFKRLLKKTGEMYARLIKK